MKQKLFFTINILFLIFYSVELKSQDTITIYFDNQWEQCNKEQASYYRKYFKTKSKEYETQDFYNNGNIQMSGTFKKRNWKEKAGHFVYYHENGNKESEGLYIDNLKTGYWISWYENGELNSKGNFVNGKRDSTWVWYFDNGQMSAKEKFSNDKRLDYNFWDENGNSIKLEDAEYLPQFPGGWDAYVEFIRTNTIYPTEAKLREIQGSVVVTLIVNSRGEIENTFIQKPINTFLDKEALRVARLLPNFIPGKQHNRFVKVSFNAPFTFRL